VLDEESTYLILTFARTGGSPEVSRCHSSSQWEGKAGGNMLIEKPRGLVVEGVKRRGFAESSVFTRLPNIKTLFYHAKVL
jgi:hypothetical protein